MPRMPKATPILSFPYFTSPTDANGPQRNGRCSGLPHPAKAEARKRKHPCGGSDLISCCSRSEPRGAAGCVYGIMAQAPDLWDCLGVWIVKQSSLRVERGSVGERHHKPVSVAFVQSLSAVVRAGNVVFNAGNVFTQLNQFIEGFLDLLFRGSLLEFEEGDVLDFGHSRLGSLNADFSVVQCGRKPVQRKVPCRKILRRLTSQRGPLRVIR